MGGREGMMVLIRGLKLLVSGARHVLDMDMLPMFSRLCFFVYPFTHVHPATCMQCVLESMAAAVMPTED